MNKREKEILQSQLNNEKAVLEKLKKTYEKALNDVNGRINLLLARNDANMQNVIYRIEYQKALKQEIQTILDKLHTDSFENISEYLTKCYEYGFCDTMYDLHGQDIPLIIPIDPAQVVDAVQHESKISEGLYKSIGKDITTLKKQIQNEISRGIASGLSYGVIARNIADYAGIAKNRAMTIARTDGHRIYIKSAIDAGEKAVKKGAHLVKQWNAAMDGLTRKTHRELDGQIRETDDDFEVAGKKASAPGMFGDPAEDCNCRCAVLFRARAAMDENELKTLKERAEYFGLDKSKDLEDFRKKYLKAAKKEG